MRFSSSRFNRHLNNLGQDFLWRRRHACPCVDPTNGAPDHRCPVCFGKGHLWNDPVEARAAPAGQKTQQSWAAMGQYENGDIAITIPENSPLWDAGPFDRVTMLNGWDHFSITLHRGRPNERLHFTPRTLDRAFYLHPQTRVPIDVPVPAVNDEGVLDWGDNPPPAGIPYALSGTRRPEYYLYTELPRNRNMHTGVRLPKVVVVRRFDLLGR